MRVRAEERVLVSLENIFDQFYHGEQLRTNQELEGNVESDKISLQWKIIEHFIDR